MQYHYINQFSLNPPLRVELINDGKYDFMKAYEFNNAIQDADVTFSMRNVIDGKLKVSKATANIVLVDQNSCDERYILEYKWKKRDVNEKGQFIGRFEITFNGDIKEEGVEYPKGNLIVPIVEELTIMIK
jgi:hypothetical protein